MGWGSVLGHTNLNVMIGPIHVQFVESAPSFFDMLKLVPGQMIFQQNPQVVYRNQLPKGRIWNDHGACK